MIGYTLNFNLFVNNQWLNDKIKYLASDFDPFQISEDINLVTYKVYLHPEFRIHHVFHISLLKNSITDLYPPKQEPQPLNARNTSILWKPLLKKRFFQATAVETRWENIVFPTCCSGWRHETLFSEGKT